MFCGNCGNPIDPNGRFCPACGTPVLQPEDETVCLTEEPAYQPPVQPAYEQPVYQAPAQPAYEQPVQPTYQQPVQQPTYHAPVQPAYKEMTWKQFYNAYVTSKWVIWMVVICFVTAGLSLILSFALEIEAGILDLVVYAAMGVLLLVTKHWAFSLVATIYGGIWSLVSLAQGGTPSGVFAIVAGVMCTITLAKARKAYKIYRETHMIPNNL